MAKGLAGPRAHGVEQAHAAAGELRQVIAFAKAEGREASAPGQGREPQHGVLLLQVEKQQAQGVAEGVGPGREAPVADPAAIQGAAQGRAGTVHRLSPKAWATRRPLTTPSSWKPLGQ